MPKFSVIIPVRQINDFLRENISHLKKLDYKDFEVLIVTDEKESFDFGRDNRFKIVASRGNPAPGVKRNVGAKKARGEILVFLDDDAYPKKDWLLQADRLFRDKEIYAIGAPAVTPPNAKFLEKMGGRVLESWLASGNTIYRHIPVKERLIDDYPTVNLFVRKKIFDEAHGFYTEFWPGEDTKFCLDIVKKMGRKFLYSPKPLVYHHRRNLFLPHLKQISRYGKHRGQFARIFPETSRMPLYFVPSLFLLGLILGAFISCFFPFLWKFYLDALLVYFVLLTFESTKVFEKEKSFKASFYFILGVFLTHLVYGYNFMVGLAARPKLKSKRIDTKTGNYLEG